MSVTLRSVVSVVNQLHGLDTILSTYVPISMNFTTIKMYIWENKCRFQMQTCLERVITMKWQFQPVLGFDTDLFQVRSNFQVRDSATILTFQASAPRTVMALNITIKTALLELIWFTDSFTYSFRHSFIKSTGSCLPADSRIFFSVQTMVTCIIL